jgi:hypothetical protein
MEAFYDLAEEAWDALEEMEGFEEMEDYAEEDEFLGRIYRWLTTPIPRQSGPGTTTRARRMALAGARGATASAGTAAGGAIGSLIAPGAGTAIGGVLGTGLGQAVASLIPQEMDYFAELAAEAEDEAEAEAFLGALVPLAARLLPQAGGAIMRVAPQLIRGVAGAARALHGHPAARQMLRTMGTVVQRTGADIARQVAQGRPPTGRMAVRRLAHHTHQVMANPQQLRRAIARRRCPSGRMRPRRFV